MPILHLHHYRDDSIGQWPNNEDSHEENWVFERRSSQSKAQVKSNEAIYPKFHQQGKPNEERQEDDWRVLEGCGEIGTFAKLQASQRTQQEKFPQDVDQEKAFDGLGKS
jgi:hypothetical protein